MILELQFLHLIFDFFFLAAAIQSSQLHSDMEEEGGSKRNIPLCEAMSIYSTSDTSELPKLQETQELP